MSVSGWNALVMVQSYLFWPGLQVTKGLEVSPVGSPYRADEMFSIKISRFVIAALSVGHSL